MEPVGFLDRRCLPAARNRRRRTPQWLRLDNLAEDGRGVARATAPGRYWRSVSFHLLLAVAINAFNLWTFFRPALPAQ